jgi:hypothetical protein
MKNSYLNWLTIAGKIILLLIIISVLNYAQPNHQDNNIVKANDMTDKLTKKLLLTEKQEESIISILLDYFVAKQNITGDGNKKENLQQEAENKIVILLDNKQKMKFSIIKDDWWSKAN